MIAPMEHNVSDGLLLISIISIFSLNVMLLERYPNTVCKTYFFL